MKALLHPKLPDQKQVRRIFNEIESKDERIELNLYIVGERPARGAHGRGGRMKVAYWPGCVSRGFTPELHGSMAKVAPMLDLELVELDRANCCGAGVIAEHNQELVDTLNARTFAMAQQVEGAAGMMNICSTCQGAQSECQERLDADAAYREQINAHLEPEGLSYESGGDWWNKNFLWILVEEIGLGKLREQVCARSRDCGSLRSTAATSCARPSGSATTSTPSATNTSGR